MDKSFIQFLIIRVFDLLLSSCLILRVIIIPVDILSFLFIGFTNTLKYVKSIILFFIILLIKVLVSSSSLISFSNKYLPNNIKSSILFFCLSNVACSKSPIFILN